MRITRLIIILTAFLSVRFGLNAADNVQVTLRHLDSRQGLAGNHVASFDFDKSGRLWIGTEEGLNVFDRVSVMGREIIPEILASSEITNVCADNDHDCVWIATRNSGIYQISQNDGNIRKIISAENGKLPSNDIRRIRRTPNGDLWVVHFGGVTVCSQDSIKLFSPSEVRNLPAKITDILPGPDKMMLVSSTEGIGLLDADKAIFTPLANAADKGNLPSDNVSTAIFDPVTGTIYAATSKGVACIKPDNGQSHIYSTDRGLPICYIEAMRLSSDGHLWVSLSHMGLWRLKLSGNPDISGTKFSHITAAPSTGLNIDNIFVRQITEDSFGNFWFATDNMGLCFIRNEITPFKWSTASSILTGTSANNVAWRGNELFVSGFSGFVDIISHPEEDNPKKSRIYTNDNNITSMIVDKQSGHTWIATEKNGIQICRADNLTEFIPLSHAHALTQSGNIIYAVESNRIIGLDALSHHIVLDTVYIAAPQSPTTAATDRQGRIWIGTANNGLFIFNPYNLTSSRLNDNENIIGPRVNQLCITDDGEVIIASGTGIGLYNPRTSSISRIIGSESNMRLHGIGVKSIATDSFDNVWFTTINALGCYNLKSGKLRVYDSSFLNMEGNFLPGAAAHSGDNLAFGSTNGVLSFKAWRFVAPVDERSSGFRLVALRVHPRSNDMSTVYIPVSSHKISLNHDQGTLTVTFAPENFGLDKELTFAYRMLGLNDQWVEANDSHSATFHGLEPGNYTFELRACEPGGQWKKDSEKISISIRPPFYASFWAKSMYALMAVMLVIWIVTLYKRTLENKNERKLREADITRMTAFNEDRLRFYTNITHELKTPLTLIIAPAEDLKNDHSLPTDAKDKINLISTNANRLLSLVNKLLTFRQCETGHIKFSPMYDDMSQTVGEIVEMFRETNCNPSLEIYGDIEPDVRCVFDREIITIILNNLMSNAVKYTRQGYVSVRLMTDHDFVTIQVLDTGVGVSEKESNKIFGRYYQSANRPDVEGIGIGLSIVKTLVTLHKGSVSVEPGANSIGSVFTVKIPFVPGSENHVIDEDLHGMAETTLQGEPSDTPHKQIVVIADDNREIAKYIQALLSHEFETYVAADGKEALELVRQHMPDIVISDILMPAMSGLELCDVIKQDESLCHIPVILLTAKSAREDITEGYKTGADSYITKPFSSQLLLTRVDNLLSSRRQLANNIRKTIMSSPVIDSSGAPLALPAADVTEAIREANPLDIKFIQRVHQLIAENISSSDFNANWLAEHMNMSPSTLYRKLRQVMGISAIEYIKRIRMKMAADMLLSGEYNISETAWRVGIGNMKYFRECFKETYGMSPTAFIAEKKGKTNDNSQEETDLLQSEQ